MNELKPSVEQLYRVFANYQLAGPVDGCPCCVNAEDKKALVSAPLRELTAENLNHYSHSAMTTWGGVYEFKHFLPRIFELVLNGRVFGADVEIVIGKLQCAEWQAWPDDEKTAIRDYLMSVWKEMLITETHSLEASDWICSVGITGENLQPYLILWVEAKSKAAYDQLLKSVKNGWVLRNAFWDYAAKGKQQVVAWLEAKATSDRLMEIYFENESADFAKPLGECIDILSAFQKE